MGKKKDAAKAARVKLPKRVAGVKVPKELRRQSEQLLGRARDAIGGEQLASGVALAATALIGRPREAPASASSAPERRDAVDYEQVGRMAGLFVTAVAGALAASLVKRD